METSPTIQCEIDCQVARIAAPRKPGQARLWATWCAHAPELSIERLVLPGEEVAARQRLDAWCATQQPASPAQVALVEQAVLAKINIERCHRLRAALQTEKLRTAELQWVAAEENETYKSLLLFRTDGCAALGAMERSAMGMRELIRRWTELETRLTEDKTWYGADRLQAIRLCGYSTRLLDLYDQEDAYWIWVRCLAAQPNPRQRDIDLILREDVMPKRLQDQGGEVWRPDPQESLQFLRDLVTGELARLRAAEEMMRINYEEPAKAAARDIALARLTKDEVNLVRELRSHERSLHQATTALEKARRGRAASKN
jgi:hypothetical protein